MPSNRVQLIVRCEDLQQRVFIYRCLREKGVHHRAIDIKNSPKGKGAGTQWVLVQYPIEVKALRSGPPASKGLISIIDADVSDVASRKNQHDNALLGDGQNARQDDDKIAILVPARNIETWIHHLLGTPGINETDVYPRFRNEERTCAPAAEDFAIRCPNRMRNSDLPSLLDACSELQRVL